MILDLAEGKAVLACGWAYDSLVAAEQNLPIDYVLPEEDTVLWADYLVVPATSPNKTEAELTGHGGDPVAKLCPVAA